MNAIDRPGPGVGAVGTAVGPVTLDERPGQRDRAPVVGDGLQPIGRDGGNGDDASVVEPLPAGSQSAVDEQAVAGGIAALPVAPGRAG